METENQNLSIDSSILDTNIEQQNIISLVKFIFLCVSSLGFYGIWWTYKAWRFYKQKENSDIMPAMRTIFGIFYFYSLLERIIESTTEKGGKARFSAIFIFIGFLVVNLLAYLPDPYWLISLLSFTFLIPPFLALNFVKLNSIEFKVYNQTKFNGRQIAVIIIGIILWVLILFGISMN
jgi:hypothetical protein